MVTGAVRHLHALAPALLWAALLGGCAGDLGSVARQERIPIPAIVRLSDAYAVAARPAGDDVEVVAFTAVTGSGWSAEVIASGGGGEMSTHLVTMGGETGEEWNSFLFGRAPEGASRVVIDGLIGSGGQVANGTWVLAFRHRDLVPSQLTWMVLDAIGGVIASGTGITPEEPIQRKRTLPTPAAAASSSN